MSEGRGRDAVVVREAQTVLHRDSLPERVQDPGEDRSGGLRPGLPRDPQRGRTAVRGQDLRQAEGAQEQEPRAAHESHKEGDLDHAAVRQSADAAAARDLPDRRQPLHGDGAHGGHRAIRQDRQERSLQREGRLHRHEAAAEQRAVPALAECDPPGHQAREHHVHQQEEPRDQDRGLRAGGVRQ